MHLKWPQAGHVVGINIDMHWMLLLFIGWIDPATLRKGAVSRRHRAARLSSCPAIFDRAFQPVSLCNSSGLLLKGASA